MQEVKKKALLLIVDDLEDNRLAIKLSLKNEPFKIIEASNGQEGLEQNLKYTPDLILTDVMMPVMDGYEFSKKIRLLSQVPIIMVSALSEREDKLKALECGVNDFISKPFDKTELLARVRSLLHFYTSFIKKQSELQTLNNALEEKVKERTKALEEEQEKKVFDAKLASIGKLAAGITHEINTPLAYIKGNIEILEMDLVNLKDKNLKNGIYKTTKTINEGINRIAMIIESMREISKKNDNKKESVNVFNTIVVSLRMIHNRSKHICNISLCGEVFSLETKKNEKSFEVFCNTQRIEQVWIIILNNALDALASSKLHFHDRSILIDITQDGNWLNVNLKDNAGGIDEDIIEQIFDPFVSTKTHSGMGIGLNVATQIIEEHNGNIKAFNEDSGANFLVRLPLNI